MRNWYECHSGRMSRAWMRDLPQGPREADGYRRARRIILSHPPGRAQPNWWQPHTQSHDPIPSPITGLPRKEAIPPVLFDRCLHRAQRPPLSEPERSGGEAPARTKRHPISAIQSAGIYPHRSEEIFLPAIFPSSLVACRKRGQKNERTPKNGTGCCTRRRPVARLAVEPRSKNL